MASAIALFTILALPACTSRAVESSQASASVVARYSAAAGEARAYAARLYDSLALPGLALVVAMLANQSFAQFRETEAGRIARMFIR